MRSKFTMFDSRERIETILHILSEEIDFENFMLSGVIKEHFPLHKRNRQDIIDEFQARKGKLMKEFIAGDFHLHFIPMNFIKSYFGEKYAFEYSFLLHYQAWLVFPAVIGVLISFF